MELYELGALFLSVGSYLTASAVPDLWPQIKSVASLAHQLLDQEKMKEKADNPEPKIILL